MLMHLTRNAVLGLALLAGSALMPAHASVTAEQAKTLAEKAAVLVAAEGDKAFPKISDPSGEFVDGELYVVVMDHHGVILANGGVKTVGMNLWEAKDPDGVLYCQEIWKIAESSGTGWVSYKFTNPMTKKIEPKKVWVRKSGDYAVFAGVYVKE
jgi:cytochrome c